jgi:hypothetical protein
MIVIIGLIILIAAVVAGVAVVLGNDGSGHGLIHLAVFGHHVTGTIGTVFLYGIVLGAVGLFGLILLLAGVRRSYRRGSAARQGLTESRSQTAESRRETAAVSKDRDDLLDQRDSARSYTASTLGTGPASDSQPSGDAGDGQHSKRHLFGPRPASSQSAAAPVHEVNGHASDVPASDVPASDVPAGSDVRGSDVPAGTPVAAD